MALRPHFLCRHDDINFRCKSVKAKGFLVVYSADAGFVENSNDLADHVAGVLVQDVVAGIHPSNINLTEDTGTINQARNFQKNQTYVSGVVRLLKIGECETNATSGTISAGDVLRFGPGGILRSGGAGEVVGTALSDKDADGYVKVYVNIQ